MSHKRFNLPRQLPPGVSSLPFSDAVQAGDTLYLAGRLGLDPQTQMPPKDVAEEARLVMEDVRNVLTAAGMSMADLVNVTIFCPDVAHFGAFNAVYLQYFEDALPARAFIGSGPLLFGARFEVTAVAIRA
jgi:reactive intermediate/imine deaminase